LKCKLDSADIITVNTNNETEEKKNIFSRTIKLFGVFSLNIIQVCFFSLFAVAGLFFFIFVVIKGFFKNNK
jgi:hypothetical protein